jgi:hypothetical protein
MWVNKVLGFLLLNAEEKNPSAHEAFAVIKPCVLKAVGQSCYNIVIRTVHACICVQPTQGMYKCINTFDIHGSVHHYTIITKLPTRCNCVE